MNDVMPTMAEPITEDNPIYVFTSLVPCATYFVPWRINTEPVTEM